jgi:hypothetical protein
MAEHVVALQVIGRGDPSRALDAVRAALDDAEVGEADATGIVEVTVEAGDVEDALTQVWNAIAAAGADDELAFAEHPDLPEHWRERAAGA